jgi:SagB-type dehydrogenase family enzyme
VLSAAVAPYPSDQDSSPSPDVAVIVNDVAGLPPGGYRYDAAGRCLLQSHEGSLRQKVAYLSLEQRLCGDAAASLFLLADLDRGAAEGGERAYRRTFIDAGLRGEFVYLAARALGVGCSGIGAFYDDEVASFWQVGPGSRVIYELVVGPEPVSQQVAAPY